MTTFLAFTTVGLVVGCIYALTATGLVVTYTTSGVFNFAHGAIGMIGAFTYWQVNQAWGWPAPLALLLVLGVLAPLFGAAIERVLIRPLHGASVDLSIVITLGLLLFLIGVANVIWKPTETRVLPEFFPNESLAIGSVNVKYSQLVVVVVALAVAIGLRLLFSRTRTGIAMRGVVDDPSLLAMTGASPARVQQLSWAVGATLAALAGILLAQQVNLDILTLTLLVINGYAAALIGQLKSLPLTAVGALALGLAITYVIGYGSGWLVQIQNIVPMIMLFGVLVVLGFFKPARLRTSAAAGRAMPTVPSLRESLVWAGALVVGAVLLAQLLSSANLLIGGRTFVLGITLLSLVLLTGYGGQASLCQLTFVGVGAWAMGTFGDGGSLVGVLAAVLAAALFGAGVAMPTLRLRGLYLALATFAFATAMDDVFFKNVFGEGGSLAVERMRLPLVPTTSDSAFFVLTAVVFAACAVGVLAVRRGRYGRQLTALNDSPAACATLGLNVNTTKLVVFTVSAGLAGLSGALFGGLRGSVGPGDFAALGSLLLLLTLRIGGVNTATGALVGAFFVAIAPTIQAQLPQLPAAAFLLTGLAAVSIGRDPYGIGGRVSEIGAKLRAARRPPPGGPPPAAAKSEEKSLVGVGG
ncbi:MAG: ABC transporter permease [Actinomycetes bacterium]